MACIMEIFSLPPDLVLEKATRKKVFFGRLQALMKKYFLKKFSDSKNQPRSIVNSRGKKRKPGSRSLSYMLGTEDKDFLNFLNKCFE